MNRLSNLKVMTFNIRYDNDWDKDHSWESRKKFVYQKISEHQPDILGIQEGMKNQVDYLNQHLIDYNYVGVGRGDGKEKDEFAAIFYNKEKLTLLDSNTFWLSKTPDEEGSLGWDANITRICTWAKFKDAYTEDILYHFNTHFDHEGEIAQIESAKLLLTKIKALANNNPVIVTGDFNVTPVSDTYKTLTGQLIHNNKTNEDIINDVCIDENGDSLMTGTFTDFGREDIYSKIDHIFIKNNINALNYHVDSSEQGEITSDHFPIIANLQIL